MTVSLKKLRQLRVRDIMHKDLIVLRANQTLSHAVSVLKKFSISGAPVVDETGACVGVISSSDFLTRESQLTGRHAAFGMGLEGIFVKPKPPVYIDCIEDNLVREHMSPIVHTISQDAPLLNAARVLCAEHIHRLVIVDSSERPIGIVTALDFVASMATALESE